MCGSSLAPQRPNVGSPWVSDVQNPLTNRLSQVLTALNPDFHASAIFSHVSSPLWMVNRQNFQVTGRRRRRARAEFEKARRSTKSRAEKSGESWVSTGRNGERWCFYQQTWWKMLVSWCEKWIKMVAEVSEIVILIYFNCDAMGISTTWW